MKKHERLEEQLITLIQNGEGCDADGRFISERKITEMFDVSRTTVRRAVSDLEKQGYLLPMHGKGTFIKNRIRTQSIYSTIRCTQAYAEMGMTPSTKIVEQKIVPATKSVAENLKIEVGAPVLYIIKLFYGNRTVFNETHSYVSIDRFPGIERINMDTLPILEILRAFYAAHSKRTENTIEAILPPKTVAKNLKITTDTPLLLFESVTYGSYKEEYLPMEYWKCYYKTNYLRFSFGQDHDQRY